MLKQHLTLQNMNWTDHYWKDRKRKLFGEMKDELGGKSHEIIYRIRVKT